MKTTTVGLALLAAATLSSMGAVVIDGFNSPYTQDFDTLANSGTPASTLPNGWAFSETGTGANSTYRVGTGSDITGDTYSFGASGSSDRALGGLQSGSVVPRIGAAFENQTGGTITALTITYTGEQWRLGAAGRTDRLDFQYSLDATSLTTGTWNNFDALDFSSPNTTTVGALNGNATGNRTSLSASITDLTFANNQIIWVRWTDLDIAGSEDGLAIDDFSVTAVPEPINLALGVFGGLAAVVGVVRKQLRRA